MYLIYMRTNIISNKSYIGVTSREEKIRWQEHIKESSRDKYSHYKISRAINKYPNNS